MARNVHTWGKTFMGQTVREVKSHDTK